jgi:hypothetical protein
VEAAIAKGDGMPPCSSFTELPSLLGLTGGCADEISLSQVPLELVSITADGCQSPFSGQRRHQVEQLPVNLLSPASLAGYDAEAGKAKVIGCGVMATERKDS